jgi:hypothetical protein
MFWDIDNARQVIDYEPEDDSEREFAKEIRATLTASGQTA